jgi:hypothetical protein
MARKVFYRMIEDATEKFGLKGWKVIWEEE